MQLPRPGLAKTGRRLRGERKLVTLVRPCVHAVAACLDGADVVSEGALVTEAGRLVYYGTTSVHVPGVTEPALFAADPHLRVLVLRIARREAESRAQSPIGPLRAELSVQARQDRFEIVADVTADVLAQRLAREPGR